MEEEQPTLWVEAWRDFKKEMRDAFILISVAALIIAFIYIISLL